MDISEQDYIDFNLDQYSISERLKRIHMQLRCLPLAMFFLIIFVKYGLANATVSLSVVVDIAMLFIGCLWFIFFGKLLKFSATTEIRLRLKEGKNNSFTGSQTVKLADDYIETVTPTRLTQIQCSAVERIACGKNLSYIYIGALEAIIIPLSAFEDEEQKKQFFSLLSEKTGLELLEFK